MLYTLAHEYTHMMRQNAKESFDKLTELLFQKYRESGDDVDALILAKQDRMGTDYDTAFEEFVADSMEAMLTDTNAAERIAGLKETDKTAWEKLKELVHKLLESIRGLYEQYSPSSVEGKHVREMSDTLEKLSDLFVEGMGKVSEQGTSEGKISYQARVGTDENTGKPIYQSNFPKGTPKADKAQRILSLIQNVWSKKPISLVAKNDDGSTRTIKAQFDPTFDNSGNSRTDASKLMGGNRHGSAAEQRVTLDLADDYYEIAAESTYNYSKDETGKENATHRGVNQWHYFINDILFQEYGEKEATPYRVTINVKERSDGEFVYSFSAERQNERPSTRRTLHADVNQADITGKANAQPSENNVPQQPPVVKKRFSMQDRDSSGRKLSQQQQKYFKDSQVRDGEGRLKVVYHGSGAQFTEFSTDFVGTHGSMEGQGFYFTDNQNMAEGYYKNGGQVLEGYLDIKNPLSDSKVTLTTAEVKRLIKAIDPTGDDLVLNYDSMGGMGYPSKAWYNRSLSATVNAVMSTSYSDSEILAELANAGGNVQAVLDKARSVLGYDGYIVDDKYDNTTVYVAFSSSQFKNANNQTPTDAPDIRYQERGTSNREILTTALESAAQNPREREVLAEYKAAADKLETYEARLRENRAKVQELTAANEKKNARKIAKLKEDIKADENRVGNVTDQMETLENRESLRALLAREREAIVVQQQEQVRQLKERLDEYREKYGTFPGGEKAAREILLPRKSKDGQKISQTVRTILEASSTPEEAIPTIEEMALDGRFSYETYSDKESIADAESEIKRVGWAQSLSSWMSSIEKGNVSKQNTAMGWALYNNAANSGDTNTALDILSHMVEHQRSAAQALQATRILKEMSPTTQLYQVQRSVENLQAELNKRFGDKKAPELKVDPELAEQFMSAPDQEGRDAAMRSIYRDIGKQMPSKFVDKWNAWRYLSMLGNVRTHVRNVVGNAGFVPVVATKDVIATSIESAVYRLSGGRTARTKALVSGKDGKALLAAAVKDYAKIQDVAMGGGKYSEFANANKYIEEGRVIFKSNVPGLKQASKALEKARRANSKALDQEDVWFSKPHYAYAMAQYCKANGITAEMIESGRGDAIAKARDYAINEAQKATYRDTNSFSQAISELGRVSYGRKSGTKKAISTIMEGILPFRKTPANILVRGVEYSPIGLMSGIKKAVFDVRKGNATSAEAIDAISAGLTGTGLLMFGIYLAAEGLVRGHGDDEEKENTFAELTGHQAYALELPDGTSVTLDWLAPECLPFFIGVNLWELTEGGTDILTMADALNAVSQVSEPLLEMSCLQSLDAIFDTVGYAKSNDTPALVGALASAGTSYLTQALPTLLGQAERTSEDIRYTTYTDPNSPLTSDMQYTLGKASARIPGVDFSQIPYIDAWGRMENTGSTFERFINNFLNPAYTSDINESAMEKELLRVYESTGDTSVFPSRAKKSIRSNGEDVKLTGEQYVEFAEKQGGNAYKWMNELVNRSEFKKLSDVEKASCIGLIYQAARETASGDIVSGYEKSSWVNDALSSGSIVDAAIIKTKYPDAKESAFEAYKEYGSSIGRDTFLEAYSALSEMTGEDYDGDGRSDAYSKIDKKLAYIDKMSLTNEQKRALAIAADISEKNIDKRAPWN